MPPPSKVIGLRLPTALKQQLADIASQQNTTVSKLTRDRQNYQPFAC